MGEQHRVLRKVFGLKMDKLAGEGRNLHNKELCNMYSSPNIIWVIKSRRMGLAGYVACMGAQERCIQGLGKETT